MGESGEMVRVSRSIKKIFRLTPNVVFTACGTMSFCDAENNSELFNFVTLVKDYFGTRTFENSEHFWTSLEDELKDTFNRTLIAGKEIDDWPLEEPNEDKTLINLIFFWIHPEQRIYLTQLSFRYIRTVPVEVSITREQFWFQGLIYAAGHTTLLHQLSRNDRSLQDVNSHPLVKMFLGGTTHPKSIRLDHATDFVRIIMKASEERLNGSSITGACQRL